MNAVASVADLRYRAWLRIEDYLLLDEAGALDGPGKTELIDGEIIRMNAQHVRHAYGKSLLHLAVVEALRAVEPPLVALVEVSVAMPPFDAPVPDITIATPPLRSGLLPVDAVALVIEVADTTQRYDLNRKAAVYARARVPEYWVIDLVAGEVVRHATPDDAGFATVDRVALGEPVAALTIRDLVVATADLLDDVPPRG